MRDTESAVPPFGSPAQRAADDTLGALAAERARGHMDMSKLAPFGQRVRGPKVYPIATHGGCPVSLADEMRWHEVPEDVRLLAERVLRASESELEEAYDEGYEDGRDDSSRRTYRRRA